MKLGKLPAKQDIRNIKFRSLLPKKLPIPPPEYDVDFNSDVVWPLPLPMFANDSWGDCVIAARSHQTLRFEKTEQNTAIDITDEDVLNEYWHEQGGDKITRPDNGLYILESLKCWRNGWDAAGQTYNIYAFAEINRKKQLEIKQGIWLLNGLQSGVLLHQTDMKQLDNGEIWYITNDYGEIVGGHAMFIIGYTRTGPVFLTWGRRQVATWDWFLKRCDEVYGVVDDRNKFMDSPINVEELDSILKQVSGI